MNVNISKKNNWNKKQIEKQKTETPLGPGPPDDDSPTEPPDPATITNEHLNHCTNNNHREQYSPRQGSLTNSTGSERESDSAYVCDSESPNDNHLHADNDVFDWWFHKNRGSHKSRY